MWRGPHATALSRNGKAGMFSLRLGALCVRLVFESVCLPEEAYDILDSWKRRCIMLMYTVREVSNGTHADISDRAPA